MRIVVADDEMLTREGIVHLLSEAGHEVVGRPRTPTACCTTYAPRGPTP